MEKSSFESTQEMLEENYLKPMNLPTKTEIGEINKDLSLKKTLKELTCQIKALEDKRQSFGDAMNGLFLLEDFEKFKHGMELFLKPPDFSVGNENKKERIADQG